MATKGTQSTALGVSLFHSVGGEHVMTRDVAGYSRQQAMGILGTVIANLLSCNCSLRC